MEMVAQDRSVFVLKFNTLSHRCFESSSMKWQRYTEEHKTIDDWLCDAEQTLIKAEHELTPQIRDKMKVFHS